MRDKPKFGLEGEASTKDDPASTADAALPSSLKKHTGKNEALETCQKAGREKA